MKKGTPLAAMFGMWDLEAEQHGNKAIFNVVSKVGGVTSDVELIDAGQTLKGTTVARSGLGQKMTYSWRAERLGCKAKS